jgi:hypothetical protein
MFEKIDKQDSRGLIENCLSPELQDFYPLSWFWLYNLCSQENTNKLTMKEITDISRKGNMPPLFDVKIYGLQVECGMFNIYSFTNIDVRFDFHEPLSIFSRQAIWSSLRSVSASVIKILICLEGPLGREKVSLQSNVLRENKLRGSLLVLVYFLTVLQFSDDCTKSVARFPAQ